MKKTNKNPPKDRETYISPNCLNVERATTFFPSHSLIAEKLAVIKVNKPKIIHKMLLNIKTCLKRINNQIPAVTKVELCTKALTGVGAAIAAGNHLVKGTWALLVIVKIIKIIVIITLKDLPIIKNEDWINQ